MAKHTITNTADGPRGFWREGTLEMLEAGATFEGEVSDADVKTAKATDYFEFGASAAKVAAKGSDKD